MENTRNAEFKDLHTKLLIYVAKEFKKQPFSLTADSIKPTIGMYAYMPNKPRLHNVVGGNASVTAGTFVKL